MYPLNFPKACVNPEDRLVKKVKKTIDHHGMLCTEESVLIGVSGGADSVALLFILFALAGDHGWKIGIAHIHHGLRGKQADADADFVAGLARKLDLPYYIAKPDVRGRGRKEKIGIEDAGRKERYAFFHETAQNCGYEKIAVGHQKNDSAEQILLNLLRGTGAEGLGGIAPVRGIVIRPLIRTRRREIESFLTEKNIAWCEDASNKDNRFTRNRVRNQLMPYLQTFNPQMTETLFRLGEVMREENTWAEALLAPVFEQAVLSRASGKLVLCSKCIKDQHRAVKRRLVRKALEELKGEPGSISLKHVEQILSAVGQTDGRLRQMHLPARILVACEGNRVVFTREKKSLRSGPLSGRQYETPAFAHRLEAAEFNSGKASVWIWQIHTRICFQCNIKYGNIDSLKNSGSGKTALMDFDRLSFPLIIRNVCPGDRFVPLGMSGTMKVNDFFTNNKIPCHQRGRVPIIETPEGIVWVGGLRISELVRVTKNTKNIIKIEISGNPVNH